MRKGLSILLILAALFGFYGGAAGLNDVLAAMSYWKDQEKTATADMSKLEDGLYQLEDLREDYLDGKDQLADGEKELSDAENKLADGREQLDEAYAEYASAPGKLAQAEDKLADGKEQLDKAAKQLKGVRTLVRYLGQLESTYAAWKPKYEKAASDRSAVAKSVKAHLGDLRQYEDFMTDASTKASFDGYINMLAANDVSGAGLKNKAAEGYVGYINLAAGVCSACSATKDAIDAMVSAAALMKKGLEACQDSSKTDNEGYDGDKLKAFAEGNSSTLAKLGISDALISSMKNGDGAAAKEAYAKIVTDQAKYNAYQKKLESIEAAAAPALSAMSSYVKHYGTLSKGSSTYSSDTIAALAGADGGQGYMAGMMQKLAESVVGNKTMRKELRKKLGSSSVSLLEKVAQNPNFVYPYVRGQFNNGCDFDAFADYMDNDPGLTSFFSKIKSMLTKTLKTGSAKYKSGLKEYRSGFAQYRQAIKAYRSAPSKLADAEAQLADGEEQLNDGKKTLEKGRSRLTEYEDGEQQVRDGLAELMGTRAEGNLQSIIDRAGGDDDFDNGGDHIDIDEGLDAVETGRGYQSDLSALVSKELTGRGIGTAAALLAGILAVAAAILSLRKKNKAAGVLAILAAVSGVFGAYYGHAAGSAFTEMAGISATGSTWVAAAVLAVVALLHSIVHFAANKEA